MRARPVRRHLPKVVIVTLVVVVLVRVLCTTAPSGVLLVGVVQRLNEAIFRLFACHVRVPINPEAKRSLSSWQGCRRSDSVLPTIPFLQDWRAAACCPGRCWSRMCSMNIMVIGRSSSQKRGVPTALTLHQLPGHRLGGASPLLRPTWAVFSLICFLSQPGFSEVETEIGRKDVVFLPFRFRLTESRTATRDVRERTLKN